MVLSMVQIVVLWYLNTKMEQGQLPLFLTVKLFKGGKGMALIDEVKQLNSESHAKWFERYFKEYDLEQKIKVSAQQGYTGHLINVLSV